MSHAYEAPKLIVLGTVEGLTAAGRQTGLLDANYPAGTSSVPGLFS